MSDIELLGTRSLLDRVFSSTFSSVQNIYHKRGDYIFLPKKYLLLSNVKNCLEFQMQRENLSILSSRSFEDRNYRIDEIYPSVDNEQPVLLICPMRRAPFQFSARIVTCVKSGVERSRDAERPCVPTRVVPARPYRADDAFN